MKISRILAAFGAGTVVAAGLSGAPAQAADDADKGIFTFVLENDAFDRHDYHYTNGLRFSWLAGADGTPDWARDIALSLPGTSPATVVRLEYSLGQDMYTPQNTKAAIPDPNDRPYAGWLYFNAGIVAETGSHLDQLQLGIGVIGPASFAEQAQDLFHKLIGSGKSNGWHYQLDNEPTLQLVYLHSWRAFEGGTPGGFGFDVIPHVGFALGNAFTYLNAGATARIGFALPDDFGVLHIEPVLDGASLYAPTGEYSIYAFAGVDGRLVGRNAFLDGSTFESSPSVDRKDVVADFEAGVAIEWADFRITYTNTWRTREFAGQQNEDRFGGIDIAYRF